MTPPAAPALPAKTKGGEDAHSLEQAADATSALVALEEGGGWGFRRFDREWIWSGPRGALHLVWALPLGLALGAFGAVALRGSVGLAILFGLQLVSSLAVTGYVALLLARVRERLGERPPPVPGLLLRAGALHLLLTLLDASFRSVLFRMGGATVGGLYPALLLMNLLHFWLLQHWLLELALEGRRALGAALHGTQRALATGAAMIQALPHLPGRVVGRLRGAPGDLPPRVGVGLALAQLWLGMELLKALAVPLVSGTLLGLAGPGAWSVHAVGVSSLVGLFLAGPLALATLLVPRLGYHGLRRSRLPRPALAAGRTARPSLPTPGADRRCPRPAPTPGR